MVGTGRASNEDGVCDMLAGQAYHTPQRVVINGYGAFRAIMSECRQYNVY
jgi:hypothetical protein